MMTLALNSPQGCYAINQTKPKLKWKLISKLRYKNTEGIDRNCSASHSIKTGLLEVFQPIVNLIEWVCWMSKDIIS